MRLEQKLVGQPARQAPEMLPPFGPSFERLIIQQLESLKLMVSDFNDPGPVFELRIDNMDPQSTDAGEYRLLKDEMEELTFELL